MHHPLTKETVMNQLPRPFLLAAIAVAAALALAACGGGSDGSSSSTTTTGASRPSGGGGSGDEAGTRTANPAGADRGQGKGKEEDGGSIRAEEGRRDVPVAPLEVSGGGSAQFHVEGGDNSIQDYGEDAGEDELRQAAEATHSFLVAGVRGEWARACSLLAAAEREKLEKVAAQSPQPGGKGCAAALAAFIQPVSGSTALEVTRVDAASLRSEGEQAFLIYVGGPGATVYAMPLHLERGGWRPAAISGVALPGVASP